MSESSKATDCWALVPARGGSKSIPDKNICLLDNKPLLHYGVAVAINSMRFSRIICSTDSEKIATEAKKLNIEIDHRPDRLSTDDASVSDVAAEFLRRQSELPDVLALIQPTSPFLLVEHIDSLLDLMAEMPEAQSGQTISPVPHNYHAWNQREYREKRVNFKYAQERLTGYNKQLKPTLYCFGNLVVVRPEAILSGAGFFAEPSVGTTISWPHNLDVDSMIDLEIAELVVQAGRYELDNC